MGMGKRCIGMGWMEIGGPWGDAEVGKGRGRSGGVGSLQKVSGAEIAHGA